MNEPAQEVARCRCGKSYTRGEWAALRSDSTTYRRYCHCGLFVARKTTYEDIVKAYNAALKDDGELVD